MSSHSGHHLYGAAIGKVPFLCRRVAGSSPGHSASSSASVHERHKLLYNKLSIYLARAVRFHMLMSSGARSPAP
uniref:Uncharacterized protein n=1 Tax=Oryza punctata TaxID=4537 RepID=A0A0E0L4D3_ORYPU